MQTRKIFGVMFTLMCAMTMSLSAQNTNETLRQKYERLEHEADTNPADWQKQYDVAKMLIEKDSELFDQEKAGKFYERIYHMVTDIHTTMPDSVFYESAYISLLNSLNQKDIQKTLNYAEDIIRYARLKNDPQSTFNISASAMLPLIMIMLERPAAGVDRLLELRKLMQEQNIQGVENTDVMLAVLYDQALEEYREWASDKLMEITIGDKPYVLLAMGLWNIEQPFMGWIGAEPGEKSVFVDEALKVYDDLHGDLSYNYQWEDASYSIVKSPGTTARLITVTPEQRQKYIEAYRKYLKKK